MTTKNINVEQLQTIENLDLFGTVILYSGEPSGTKLLICDGIVKHPSDRSRDILITHTSLGKMTTIDLNWAVMYGHIYIVPRENISIKEF